MASLRRVVEHADNAAINELVVVPEVLAWCWAQGGGVAAAHRTIAEGRPRDLGRPAISRAPHFLAVILDFRDYSPVSSDRLIFNPAPGWPTPPAGWAPPAGWQPDPSWPDPPPGWRLWVARPGPVHAAPDIPSSGHRRFELWGTRGHWCNQEVSGTQYHQDEVIALLPDSADVDGGAELDTTAELFPEPGHPTDANAVSVKVGGIHVGYLPRDIAPAYSSVFASMHQAGQVPTVPVHLWAHAFNDYDEQLDGSYATVRRYYTRASIALAEPEMLRPINLPPPRPRPELPVGASVKVVNTQANFKHLSSVLAGRHAGWVYATLHRVELAGPRSKKAAVEVRVNGRAAGALTPQTSEIYLPIIDRLDAADCTTVSRVLLEGSPVSVVGTMHAVRPHEITAEWLAAAEQGS